LTEGLIFIILFFMPCQRYNWSTTSEFDHQHNEDESDHHDQHKEEKWKAPQGGKDSH